ncbi:MAG: exodeoxyribonuclease VII small subunit [Elusimicrobiota bacterium]
MKKDGKKELKFEVAIARLEEIVAALESGNVELDKSLELFEEGIGLVKYCNEKINEVKGKIEILMKTGEGKFIKKVFEEDNSKDGDGNIGKV